MPDPQIRLTRDQLAQFLPNPRAVKAFEELLLVAGTTLPDNIAILQKLVEEVTIESGSNTSRSELALAQLDKIENRINTLSTSNVYIVSEDTEDGEDGISIMGPQGLQGEQGIPGLPGEDGENVEDAQLFGSPSSLILNTLDMLDAIRPNSVAGIVGTTTNNNATAGSVGEIITAHQTVSQALTTTVPLNVTSINLTAGQWDVFGAIFIIASVGTLVQNTAAGASIVSATLPATPDYTYYDFTTSSGAAIVLPFPTTVLQLAAPTTVYLVARVGFTTSTCNAQGKITAIRRR